MLAIILSQETESNSQLRELHKEQLHNSTKKKKKTYSLGEVINPYLANVDNMVSSFQR